MAIELPFLGAGVSYRGEWAWELIRHRDDLGVVEVAPENVVGDAAIRDVVNLNAAVPVLLHGIGLSLGSAEGVDGERLEHMARLAEAVHPAWISEHIAFTRAGGVDIGHLTPLPFTREAAAVVATNVQQLRRAIPGVPVLVENIAYTLALPGAEMSEAEFVRTVVETADCGLLLDLENVHANALNHGYDPIEYLSALPLERAAEAHLAGGVWHDGAYHDTHTHPVPEESWELLDWLVVRAPIRAVIVERDDNLPPFEEVLAEVTRAGRTLNAAAPRDPARARR